MTVTVQPGEIDLGQQANAAAVLSTSNCTTTNPAPTPTWSASPPGAVGLSATTGTAITVTGQAENSVTLTATAGTVNGSTTLQVVRRPRIQLSATALNFSASQNGALPATQTFTITNSGGGTLSGLGAVTGYDQQPTNWATVVLFGTTATPPNGVTVQVTINTTALNPGTYTATLSVGSPIAANSPQTVRLTYVVSAASGTMGLNPGSVTFSAQQGGASPPSQSVTVTSTHSPASAAVGAIVYGAGQPAGWLSASISQSPTPATLTLTAATGGLVAGTYTATVPVSVSGATNSPQSVNVTFNVSASAPSLLLSESSVSRLFLSGGTAGNMPSVTVNSSGAPISGVSVGTINYGAGATGWIQGVGQNSAVTPAVLTVSVTPAGLAPGLYSATVPIQGNGAATQSLTINITVLAAPGGTIVFERSLSGGQADFEVWRMAAHGAAQTQLTSSPGLDGRPWYSGTATDIAFRSDRTGNAEIWLSDPNGGTLRQVTNSATLKSFPAIFPGRPFLIYSVTDPLNQAVQSLAISQFPGIVVICLPGSCPATDGPLALGQAQAWPAPSPTAPVYAFGSNHASGNLNQFEIWARNWSTATTLKLSSTPGADDRQPAYSPDGTKIVFTSLRPGNPSYQIWVMNSDGSGQIQLTTTGNNLQPFWSPDGTRIVFVSDRAGGTDLYMMNANGTNQVNITNSPAAEGRPTWR